MLREIEFHKDKTKAISRRKIVLFAIFALLEMALIVLMILLARNIVSAQIVTYTTLAFRFIAVILSFHIVFARHDKSEYRFMWLLLIILEPFLGSIFYLIFAERKLKHKVYDFFAYDNKGTGKEEELDLSQVSEDLKPLARFLSNTQSQQVFNDTKFELYMPCDDVYERLIEDIRQAKSYILLQTFIMSSGKFLTSILDELEKKKNLKVYFYTDDFGSFASIKYRDVARMRKIGINFVRYNKIHIIFHPYSNYRNHRKMIIIDGKIGYIGGMNIADEYLNWTPRFGKWLDSIARLEGRCIANFVESFKRDWKMSSKIPLKLDVKEPLSIEDKTQFNTPVQFYTASPSADSHSFAEEVLVNLLLNAKKSIRIITPYLSLTTAIYNALFFASNSGVEVSVIIPGIADKKFVYLETLNMAHKLSKNSINVSLFSDGFAHAKMIIIDEKCVNLSSVNLDYRSFYLSFEVGINIYSHEKCLECIDKFEKILKECKPFVPQKRTIRARILNWFAIMLRSYF